MKFWTTNLASKKNTVFLSLLFIFTNSIAQEDVNFIDDTFNRYDLENPTPKDSLLEYSYRYLKEKHIAHKKDTFNSLLYIEAYLRKAKKEKNIDELLKGYLLNLRSSENESDLVYGDSLIWASRILKDKKNEARAYFYKGIYYDKKRKYKLSVDYMLIADSIISQTKNNVLKSYFNFNMGMVKTRLGENKEALAIFKNCYEEAKSKKNDSYFKRLFFLAYTYHQNKELDSAMKYCKLGILESKNYINNPKYYHDFLLIKGIMDISLDNIEDAKKNITLAHNYYISTKIEQPNLAFCYYYTSVIDRINKKYTKSIVGMHKVDSLYLKYGSLHPKVRGAYEVLISHYKSKNDLKKQLLYVERLLEIDSYTHDNYRHLSKNITDKYDTPKLLKKKEQLIHNLSNKNKKKERLIHNLVNKNKKLYIIFIPIILVISSLVFINYRKKRVYKKRLDIILQDTPATKKENTASTPIKTEINISDDVRNSIVTSLGKFVDEEKFVEKDITVGNLAKQIGTNAKYLAAVIKERYDKTFIRFINDLRVEYAIEKLKADPKFRLYTIQGIAELSGFGHTESFTRAFVKKNRYQSILFSKKLKIAASL